MEKDLDIFEVINYVAIAHNGQTRKVSGIPRITHLCGVGMLLKYYNYDNDIIKAGLLHDLIEDAEGYTLDDVEAK